MGSRHASSLLRDQYVADDMSASDLRIGQALFTAGMAVVEFCVIQAQLVQQRGMQIRAADSRLDGTIAEFVGRTIGVTRFEATTGQQQAERVAIVVSTVSVL